MSFNSFENHSGRRLAGMGAVIALHLLIVYALVMGLKNTSSELTPHSVDVRLIEDVVRTTPTAPPQPQPPAPKLQSATPRTVTPTEPAAVAETVAAEAPSIAMAEPAAQAAPPPAPAPAAPSASAAAPAAAVVCPGYQEAIRTSAPPREVMADGLGGEVLVEFTVTPSGVVRNPIPISSTNPRLNRWALHTVLTQIRCQPQAQAVQLRVPISVRFE